MTRFLRVASYALVSQSCMEPWLSRSRTAPGQRVKGIAARGTLCRGESPQQPARPGTGSCAGATLGGRSAVRLGTKALFRARLTGLSVGACVDANLTVPRLCGADRPGRSAAHLR